VLTWVLNSLYGWTCVCISSTMDVDCGEGRHFMYACIYVYRYVYAYVYTFVCMYMCMYMYIHML
jgi:hypothetical protein